MIEIGGIGGGGSGSGFTPVYGGWYQSDDTTPTTATTDIDTDYTLASGVITAKDGTTGLTVVAGGGLRNTSGSTGIFLFQSSGGTMYTTAARWFDLGCRVRQTDDTTFDAMIVGDHEQISTTGSVLSGKKTWECIVTLQPNETVFRAIRRTDSSNVTVSTLGGSATMERIA